MTDDEKDFFAKHTLIGVVYRVWYESDNPDHGQSGFMNDNHQYTDKKLAENDADKYNSLNRFGHGYYRVKTIKQFECKEDR